VILFFWFKDLQEHHRLHSEERHSGSKAFPVLLQLQALLDEAGLQNASLRQNPLQQNQVI
jgi:hypothetical protein